MSSLVVALSCLALTNHNPNPLNLNLLPAADIGFGQDNRMQRQIPVRPPVAPTADESRLTDHLEGYVPVFQRKEVTELIKQGEHGGIDHLDKRLEENVDWNSGEILLLQDIVRTIAEFMRKCQKEERPNLAKLEEKYNMCTKDYQDMYRSIANITNGEEETCKWSGIVETCKSIQVPQEQCFQSATSIPALYKDARAIESNFHNALETLLNEEDLSPKHPDPNHRQYLVKVEPGPMKKLTRLIEKTLNRNEGCACVMDVVRAMIVCKSNADMCRTLKKLAAKDSPVTIWKVKEGYSNYEDGQWVDIKVIVSMTREDFVQKHKCELQIVHERMDKARQDIGGHWAYARYRRLAETIARLKEEQEGAASVEELAAGIRKVVASGNPGHVEILLKAFRTELEGYWTKTAELGSKIGNLEVQLPGLIKIRDFETCLAFHQREIDKLREETPVRELAPIEKAVGAVPRLLSQGQLEGDTSFLDQLYPSVPLSEYKDDGNFWFINKEYPGLRAISKDPWIFLVPNLLSLKQCKKLMMKGGPHMVQSKTFDGATGTYTVDKHRTSWDVRVPYEETPGVQGVFSKLLNIPKSHMEPLKLIRYKSGEYFGAHHDANATPNHELSIANRIITLFVYLDTCEHGGETHFTRFGIKIKPQAGMGVVHFPAYMNTAPYQAPKSIQIGTKVRGRTAPGMVGSITVIGTVTKVDGKTVCVELDDGRRETAYEMNKLGDLKDPSKDFTMLPNMHFLQDQRLRHEGMVASDEKVIATQWCYPGNLTLYQKEKSNPIFAYMNLKPLDDKIL